MQFASAQPRGSHDGNRTRVEGRLAEDKTESGAQEAEHKKREPMAPNFLNTKINK